MPREICYGFQYLLPEISYRNTAVPDAPDQGILMKRDSMNMVFPFLPLYLLQQMTRSKSESLKDGLAESGLTSIVLLIVKTIRRVELIT